MHQIKKMVALTGLLMFIIQCSGGGSDSDVDTGNETIPEEKSVYIDVHCHLHGTDADYLLAAEEALAYMDKWHIEKMIVMPPPFTNQASQDGKRYSCDVFTEVVSQYPDRFCFLCGGNELNVMIQKAVTGEVVSEAAFKSKARELADTQGFVGFGEMATLHFCMGENHVFQVAPPDHVLFKALVDVASEKNVPIDIHQEALPQDMDFPELVTQGCADNPSRLTNNVNAFKNLLSYASGKSPVVNIIWDHVGWDNTGMFTPELCDALLGEYANLYLSIKYSPNDSPEKNRIVDADGTINSEWFALFEKYPTRFMIGADQFFVSPSLPNQFPPSMDATWAIRDQLPEALKTQIGYKNAQSLFKL